MDYSFKKGLYDELLSAGKYSAINEHRLDSNIEEIDSAEFSKYAGEYVQRLLKLVIENLNQ